ncbi:MAG: DUF6261 family protein [Tannerellaceae bacterium]|jgi:hypothetical protein|nr:DUF6261 family protein [Tannerellaceae bacterium]
MSVQLQKFQNLLNNQLSHGQTIQFHKNIIDDAVPTILTVQQLADVCAEYQARFAAMDAYFAKLRKRYETEVLSTKDNERDYVTRSIAGKIHFFEKYPQSDAEKEEINRLSIIYDTYKNADRKDYEAETTLLRRFMAELRKNAALIAKFNLVEMIDHLEQLNNDFETLYNDRTLIMHSLKEAGNMRLLRKEANAAFGDVCQALAGLSLMPITDAVRTAIASTVTVINANIEQFTATYHRHAGIVASKKKKDPSKGGDKQKPDNTKPAAPDTPPQTPNITPPPIDPDELNPPAVGER